jgi:hypothetical protein
MKSKFHWRRFSRALHRDLGYFFTGAILIYALSGIALNHRGDWNPSYIVKTETLTVESIPQSWNRQTANEFLKEVGIESRYRKHYAPDTTHVRIFHKKGSVTVDLKTKEVFKESLEKRPLFHTINKLHFNPGRWWTWFSDIFAICLILITVTGLILVKGKKGMLWRGTILVALGILLPGILAFLSL